MSEATRKRKSRKKKETPNPGGEAETVIEPAEKEAASAVVDDDDNGADEAGGGTASAEDTGATETVLRSATDDSDSPTEISTESVVEAVLFATDEPLSAKRIAQILGVGDARDVKKHIEKLNRSYAETGRSFRIEEIAKGFQMLTLPAYNNWLKQVFRVREETKLSRAAMETLAIVAYKQPVLRADVESIRGVAAGEMINRLREMNLVKIVGRAEELGRPMLYGTTTRFLEVFGLASLQDLPKVEELTPPSASPKGDTPEVEATTGDTSA